MPWCLARDEAPPEGPLVATWFHYNEVRRRWPHRLPHVRFATVRPAPGVADALLAAGARGSALLAELEPGIARDIAADVTALLPEGSLAVEPRVVEAGRAGELLERQPLPVLFSPRLWGALAPDERAHPRAVEVRYAFPPAELDAIGTHFGWTRRARARRSRHSAAPAR